jgi:hypothetical protein
VQVKLQQALLYQKQVINLDVEVDNSSIEVTADALNVKALGVTNAMLAGSITRSQTCISIYQTFQTKHLHTGEVSIRRNIRIFSGRRY